MTVNVSEFLRAAAVRDPGGIALVEPRTERSVTWAELDAWADRVAQALSGLGLVAGNRVVLVMANGIDQCVAWFGLLRGGLVAVPVSPRITPDAVGSIVADTQAKVVVGDAESITRVRAADVGSARVVVHRVAPEGDEIRFGHLLEGAPTADPVAPPDAEALAAIFMTTGTSGRLRGAMLTHRALIANIEQLAQIEPPVVSSDDVLLGLLPMSHLYGLNAVLGQAVHRGARVVLVNSFDPDEVLHLIASEGITNVPLAPPIIDAWAERAELATALSGVRVVVSGAAPLDPEVAESFHLSSGHHVEQGYGLTETGPVITVTLAGPHDEDGAPPSGSVGRPLPGIELELRDGLGNLAAPGDPAQVWVRGDNVFNGYWPDGRGGPDASGWYATGDMAFADSDGNLTLVDRVREVLKVSGFPVYPSEVEEVVAEVPGVDQVAVVGRPDEDSGEVVVAFVVPEDLSATDGDALSAAVLEACERELARFKVPHEVRIIAGLPHSPTGKIARGRLRAMARGDAM